MAKDRVLVIGGGHNGLVAAAYLAKAGKDVTLTVHPGTGHAFMGPHNALGTLDEDLAARIWPEVTAFLHSALS